MSKDKIFKLWRNQKMKNLWVLSVKTSLPYVCEFASDLKTEFFAFESFETAKQALRNKLKEYAFSRNSMFDGNGNMIYFKEYVERMTWEADEDEEYDEDALTKSVWQKIYNAVKCIFQGENADISEFEDEYTDYMIAVEFNNSTMTMRGDDDGPCNGYCPEFATNMFDMSEEKDYYLYVDDRFGQIYATSELYIDLKMVEIQ